MARGAEAKARKRSEKKEARKQAEQMLDGSHDFGAPEPEEELPAPKTTAKDDGSEDSDDDDVPPPSKAQKAQKKRSKAAATAAAAAQPKQGIKTLPLVMLIMLTGTTVIPALIFAGDWFGNVVQKNNLVGNIGYRLGIGATPKKRVLSFYEKHDPSKIDDVPSILGKYYGNYPQLIKKLERKYQDYGYFIKWEDDEAPMTLALDKLVETRDYIRDNYWNRYAPQFMKTGARNFKYNVTALYKKFKKVWKKHVWPMLEPIFGVPKGSAAQKRKDAQEAREARRAASRGGSSGGGRRRNTDYRDDMEDET